MNPLIWTPQIVNVGKYLLNTNLKLIKFKNCHWKNIFVKMLSKSFRCINFLGNNSILNKGYTVSYNKLLIKYDTI